MVIINTRQNHLLSPLAITDECYGLFALFVSALLFSIGGVFLKRAAQTGGYPSTELVFLRAVFQSVFVVGAMMCITTTTTETSSTTDNMTFPSPLSPPKDNKPLLNNDDDTGREDIQPTGDTTTATKINPSPIHDESLHHHTTTTTTTTATATISSYLLICKPLGATRPIQKIVVLRGLIGGCGFVCYYHTLRALPLGDAITIFSLYPIFTILFATFFLGEVIRPIHIVAISTSTIGALFITQPSWVFGSVRDDDDDDDDDDGDDMSSSLGYATGLLGSVFASGVMILVRRLGTMGGVHTLQLLFSWAIFGITLSLIVGHLPIVQRWDGEWIWQPSSLSSLAPEAWWNVGGMCVFSSVAHFLFNFGGKKAPAGLGAIVRSSDILWGYVLEVFVMGEVPEKLTIAGVILILFSLVVIAYDTISGTKERERNINCNDEMEIALVDDGRCEMDYGSIACFDESYGNLQ